MDADRVYAERFIETLTGSLDTPVTFQTFNDCKDADSALPPEVLGGTLAECWDRLCALNDAGHGIFITINATPPGRRLKEDVTALRALFVDDDTATLGQPALAPNMIVLSGRGQHCYWILADGEPLDSFASAQVGIARKLGTDPAVKDLSRVMRLPGFYHLKDRSKPAMVSVVAGGRGAYTIDQVMAGLGATYAEFARPVATPTGNGLRRLSGGGASPLVRAQALADAKAGIVQGEGQDRHAVGLAGALVRGFMLTDAEALPILESWGARCTPPINPSLWLNKFIPNAHRHLREPYGDLLEDSGPVTPALAPEADAPGAWTHDWRNDPANGAFAKALAEYLKVMPGANPDTITIDLLKLATDAQGNPLLDPAFEPINFFTVNPESIVYDKSRSKAAWREWNPDPEVAAWTTGMTDGALDRFLTNSGLTKRSVAVFKSRVVVIMEARHVYEKPAGIVTRAGVPYLNLYIPATIQPQAGDWSPVLQVIQNQVAGEPNAAECADYLIGWIAAIVRAARKGKPVRMGVAPTLYGEPGAGKGVLVEVIKALLGPSNCVNIRQEDVTNNFNAFTEGKLFVFADEVISSENFSPGFSNKIKAYITDTTRLVEPKFVNPYTRTPHENWLFASNGLRPVPVEEGDRRLVLFRTGGPIPLALGKAVAEDARAGGPLAAAFLAHLLNLPENWVVKPHQLIATESKESVMRASSNTARKFAQEIRDYGLWEVLGFWRKDNATPGAILSRAHPYVVTNPEEVERGAVPKWRLISVGGTHLPVIARRELMQAYRAFVSQVGGVAQSETTLYAVLKATVPGVEEVRIKVGGEMVRGFTGFPAMLPDPTREAEAPKAPTTGNLFGQPAGGTVYV